MKSESKNLEPLRQRAETALAKGEIVLEGLTESERRDVTRLLEELRVYQAELEVQNRELRDTQASAESGRRRFELLFSRLPLAALVVNDSGIVQEANRHACMLLDPSAKTLRDRSLFRLIGDTSDQALITALRCPEQIENQHPPEVHLFSDDRARHFELYAHELPSEFHLDRHILLLLVDHTDESELQNEHQKLKLLQQRHQIAQQATGAGIWLWDFDAKEIIWDAMCCQLVGWPAEERSLSLRDWSDLVHSDDQPEVKKQLDHYLLTNEIVAISMRMRTVDNEWRWFQARGQVVERSDDGASHFLVGTLIDIDAEKQANDRADEALRRLDKLAEHVPGVLYQFQQWPDGRVVIPYSSPGMKAIYGHDQGELAVDARQVFDHIDPDDLPRLLESIAESGRTLQRWSSHHCVNLPEKGMIWVEGEATPERQPDGSTLWHGMIRDITARKQLEEQLEDERRRLTNILWGTGAGTWEWNVQTGEVRFNERWAGMLGYSLEELEPIDFETWERLTHAEDLARAERLLKLHFDGQVDIYECEARMRHKAGSWVWVLARGRVITRSADGQPEWLAGTHTDISARKEAELQLTRMAQYDNLTGLPGRALLADRLEQAMYQARRRKQWVAVLFIDLDGFKQINDEHGHARGDAVLIELSKRLQSALRDIDTVARLGGDEFVAVLGDLADRADCHPLLDRMLLTLAQPIELESIRVAVTASIGVSFYPQADRVSSGDLITRCDMAMYRAKAEGKKCYRFDEHDPAAMRLERQIQQA